MTCKNAARKKLGLVLTCKNVARKKLGLVLTCKNASRKKLGLVLTCKNAPQKTLALVLDRKNAAWAATEPSPRLRSRPFPSARRARCPLWQAETRAQPGVRHNSTRLEPRSQPGCDTTAATRLRHDSGGTPLRLRRTRCMRYDFEHLETTDGG